MNAHKITLPDRVRRGLDKNCDARSDAYAQKQAGELDQVAYCRRISELEEREARWWALLEGWAYSARSGGLSSVFGKAAIVAEARARDSAKNWRERAQFWADRRTAGAVPERAA